MLNSLEFKGMELWDQFEVPKLGRVNLIVGKNGVGKTTLLDMLQDNVAHADNVPCVWWNRLSGTRTPGSGEQMIQELIDAVTWAPRGILLADGIDDGLHYSMMDEMWGQLFNAAVISNIQIFATTHSRDCVESFSRVASAHKDIGGVLFRLGISVKNSNKGKVIATVFGADALRDAIESGIEVR